MMTLMDKIITDASSASSAAATAAVASDNQENSSVRCLSHLPPLYEWCGCDVRVEKLGIDCYDGWRRPEVVVEVELRNGKLVVATSSVASSVTSPKTSPTTCRSQQPSSRSADRLPDQNWSNYIRSARDRHDQNVEVVLSSTAAIAMASGSRLPQATERCCRGHLGDVAFCAVRLRTTRALQPGDELVVWFGDELSRLLGVPVLGPNNIRGHQHYACTRCPMFYSHPNPLKSHVMYRCKGDAAAMAPTTWPPSNQMSTAEPNLRQSMHTTNLSMLSGTFPLPDTMPDCYTGSADKCRELYDAVTSANKLFPVWVAAAMSAVCRNPYELNYPALRRNDVSASTGNASVYRQRMDSACDVVDVVDCVRRRLKSTTSLYSDDDDLTDVDSSSNCHLTFWRQQLERHQTWLAETSKSMSTAWSTGCLPQRVDTCPSRSHYWSTCDIEGLSVGDMARSSRGATTEQLKNFQSRDATHIMSISRLCGNDDVLERRDPMLSAKSYEHASSRMAETEAASPDDRTTSLAQNGSICRSRKRKPTEHSDAPDRNSSPAASSLSASRTSPVTSSDVDETFASSLNRVASSRHHQLIHKCVHCGKMYSRRYGLTIHLRTHTGDKPLECPICRRPFGDPSNLNKHVRLHAAAMQSVTGNTQHAPHSAAVASMIRFRDSPYRCQHCGKVLVRRRDLERHIRSRHPEIATAACAPSA